MTARDKKHIAADKKFIGAHKGETETPVKGRKRGSGLTNTARITIWYTMFLALISGSLTGVIFYVYNHRGQLSEETEINIFVLLLPIILVLAALGGYLITRQSFAPVRKIIETTDEITKDGDLSRRIPLGTSRDEIYDLANSFNNMFDRLEDMVKREKQFTSDASHELRTPIAVIQSQSEYAMEDEEYAPQAAAVINRESRRMSSLITSLLMISRSESGRMIPDIELTDLGDLIREIVNVKRRVADEIGVKIVVELPDELVIRTDDEMLARIAVNLVDNALKYGKHPNGNIKISGELQGDRFVLTVSDDGEGIKDEDRDRIWERFYQADESRSGEDSSGLGLSIIQSLVNALGGTATLLEKEESELGGASFRISIPADENFKKQASGGFKVK